MKTYFLLEVDIDDDAIAESQSDLNVQLKSKQLTIKELLDDPEFRKQLIAEGWYDGKNLEKIDKTKLGPRVLLASRYGRDTGVTGYIIDLANKRELQYLIQQQCFVAVEIPVEELEKAVPEASDTLKKIIAERKRQKKLQEEARKKRQITVAERKKKIEEKKLRDAKEILKNAGVKIVE